MEHDRTRRRVLQATGTGTALSLAGCLDSLGGDGGGNGDDGEDRAPDVGNGTDNTTQDDGSGDGNETDQGDGGSEDGTPNGLLTAAVEPDQEELQTVSEDINQRVQDGNLSQQQAQQEYQQRQQELTQEAAEAFESDAEGLEDVTIEDSVTQAGAFLLDGDPAAVIELLNEDENVSALLPVATFQQVQAQQGAGAQPQP